ncbi:cation-translocating P-type ATPase [Olivibacter sp. XZL3]|uniref:cation-translocating P-type ATPase n=1 Tax=Olivibacter sp. XZL3 TaxID=1735116 RepID=UPI0010665EA6|nr:cation-translocating P-type ATPase [Olivibacter sp. XZL3]
MNSQSGSDAARYGYKGLTPAEVARQRRSGGENLVEAKKEGGLFFMVLQLVKEPMVLLLLSASAIYFVSGEKAEAIFLAVSIVLIAVISIFQDTRSRNAIAKLRQITAPMSKVIRSGNLEMINSKDLVRGDYLVVEEGDTIAADARVLASHDFAVNESILTGESLAVSKNEAKNDIRIFQGTSVVSGSAVAAVTAIGQKTELAKIGKSIADIVVEKTPLEIQLRNFVTKMAYAGTLVFLIVWAINYAESFAVLDSLLKALTLAMSILPEEIPVAFTTFMALGAWRLMKDGVLVKQMKTVEALGSATVICTDKTGTLTENKMSLVSIYAWSEDEFYHIGEQGLDKAAQSVLRTAMWASEVAPFDPMEQALHQAYERLCDLDERPLFHMVYEYPLGGTPPMMTHVFENGHGERIVAAKGAPEAFYAVSNFSKDDKDRLEAAIHTLATKGYRLLGVGHSNFSQAEFPENQVSLSFEFVGLVAFYDPPKKNIKAVLKQFYRAGIKVKIVTGDNAVTTSAIAEEIDFYGRDQHIEGAALLQLEEPALTKAVMENQIFSRMFPTAKLKVMDVLKMSGEVVGMVGDGVNDGPALRAAHIGIAMGKKGSEMAKEAASLILLEDDLSKMLTAVTMGRKIYTNLKKAIQYIISIHIPIILVVFIPLVLGWMYPHVFSPVHVIFLELVMGPTCSIVYENEPVEPNIMDKRPRPLSETFFTWRELGTSIVQGLAITVGVLAVYWSGVYTGQGEAVVRTMVFLTLITANIALTLVNRSFYYSLFEVLRYKNVLIPLIIFVTVFMLVLFLTIAPLRNFFGFEPLSMRQLSTSTLVGCLSVIWYELVKWFKRRKMLAI